MEYIIIGNSAAAVGTVEGIRSVDPEGKITLIADEPHHTYSRPLISYLIEGKTDREHMLYRDSNFYNRLHINTRLGERVTAIDPAAHTVTTDAGETLHYDRLMNATGSHPFLPPMQGLETVEERTSFMSLDDADRLSEMMSPEKDLLIVGAGLIGLKCAECALGKVKSITVIDLADRVMPSVLDAEGAGLVQRHMEQKGVRFILAASAKEFQKNTAVLTNGQTVPFDILVTAVGVRPNVELVKAAGGTVNRGIVVNQKGETSLPDVYAAGDCVESVDISSGDQKIMALLPNAYMGGYAAGVNMAGGRSAFENPIPMNSIGFFGLHLVTAGSYSGEELTFRGAGEYKRLFVRDNRLIGYIIIGNVRSSGIYTALIRNKTPLDETDFAALAEQPALTALSRAYRDEKLGGKKQ